MNSSITFEEILVSQTFEIDENELRQIFSYNKRNKAAKYLKDYRYLLYDKLERRVREMALSIEGVISFKERKDEEDHITLVYEIIEHERFDASSLNASNFKLVDYVPPSAGCPWCIHKRPADIQDDEESIFFFCEAKQKNLTHEVKNCKYFKQKRLFKT